MIENIKMSLGVLIIDIQEDAPTEMKFLKNKYNVVQISIEGTVQFPVSKNTIQTTSADPTTHIDNVRLARVSSRAYPPSRRPSMPWDPCRVSDCDKKLANHG